MTALRRASSRRLGAVLAVTVVLSAAVIVWVGYRAVVEWRHAASQVAARRAESAVDLLVSALSHDMRGAHLSTLAAAERDMQSGSSTPTDLLHPIASAFARYPYTEAFFSWQNATETSVVFYSRPERRPPWLSAEPQTAPFPVVIGIDAALGHDLLARINRDTAQGRRLSVFSMQMDGAEHQVVASIGYADRLRERPIWIIGYFVDLGWVREHYFSELVAQVGDIEGRASGVHLAILDEGGRAVVGTADREAQGAPVTTRAFPLAFFDPLAVAADPPTDLHLVSWTAVATARDDPTLAAAESGSARRMLAIGAVMTLTMALALVASLRAARVSTQLAMMRADFVSAVTHELKTPIANVRAISETLASGRTTPEMVREYAQLSVGEANRLTRLIDNLLAYSRVTDVADVYSFEPVVLAAIVQRSVQEFDGNLKRGGFDVTIDIPADLPFVYADPTAIGLMLNNLIDNAIRYSNDRHSLTIAARAAGNAVRLDVADQGVGIPDDEVARVTHKFFRGRGALSGGSGLGLAIVDRIVTDHHGTLQIRSTVGQGTTVSVTIPAARS